MSVAFLKRIGDVLQEDQAEGDMRVFSGVHVTVHLIGSGLQFFLKAEGRAIACAPFGVPGILHGDAVSRRYECSFDKR